jgi:NADPH:quinone reductase-like Zn-dependent oxidoreductase
MPQFKRIQYHQYGGPELLRLESVDVPTPGKGEVLVRVRAAAANPIDWRVRRFSATFQRPDVARSEDAAARRSAA